MTVWHFNWTAPKYHLDIKLIRKEGKNLMFICLFQNDDTIGTRRLALVFTTLEADWHKSNSAFFVKMSQNVPDVGLNSSNLFLLTLIGERQKKQKKKTPQAGVQTLLRIGQTQNLAVFWLGFFLWRMLCGTPPPHRGCQRTRRRSLAPVPLITGVTGSLLESSKGRAE